MFTRQQIHTNYDKEKLINLLASYGIKEPVLSTFAKIPREKFINRRHVEFAYEDRALPIGEDQTISQPSLVALMLQALGFKGDEKVLEIGTGSGYQTALISRLAKEVYSIERMEELAKSAEKILRGMGVKNARITIGDGTEGLAQHAPFDAIVVSAAFKEVPQPLVEQLKEGGKLVMPIGKEDWQDVNLYRKKGGTLKKIQNLSPAKFVPLIGKYGWNEKNLS